MQAVNIFTQQIQQAPDDAAVAKLRIYLADATSIADPRECWAHSGIIRQAAVSQNGKIHGLVYAIPTRKRLGGLRQLWLPRGEWSFHDIRPAFGACYHRRWPPV